MPRIVDITVRSDRTAALVDELRGLQGVLGLRLQSGASLEPPGDLVTVQVINRAMPALVQLVQRHGIGDAADGSFSTAEPVSIVPSASKSAVVEDSSEAIWEEMEFEIAKQSNPSINALLIMGMAGAIAAAGILNDTLHLVIGAMAIAPGFNPLVRIALGWAAASAAWKRGIASTLKGYGALLAGAAAATALLERVQPGAIRGQASYLANEALIAYWTTVTPTSVLISVTAGVAGALLIASHRTILTAGVMIALALVPGVALIGIGLVLADPGLAGRGLLRWGVDVAGVIAAASAVLFWKRLRVHRRAMLL